MFGSNPNEPRCKDNAVDFTEMIFLASLLLWILVISVYMVIHHSSLALDSSQGTTASN